MRSPIILFVVLFLALSATAQPQHLSYQGQLLANGQSYTGQAQFKFAIIRADASATLWSNDGSSSAGSEPASSVALDVVNGLFSARLGDVSSGQVALDAGMLGGESDVALRVWVDTGSGFEQLSDQAISSSAFAMQADAANRALGDFSVPGTLNASSLVLPNAASAGFVLTSDAGGLATWQPAPTNGGADSDWTVNGGDMFANVAGNVGIGTSLPQQRLHVSGISRFELASDRWIDVSTPGGWPGFIAVTPSGHRRDVIFDDNGMRLLAGGSGDPPPPFSGVTIRENGWVGINEGNPSALLDVNGELLSNSVKIKNSGWTDVFLSGDGTSGGVLDLHGPSGVQDYGVAMKGNDGSGGGLIDVYNAANIPTVELIGNDGGGGLVAVGNGSAATLFLDGSSGNGAQIRANNAAGVMTYSTTGQAYASGSQTRMYDGNTTLAHEWTAANREWKSFASDGTTLIRSAATTSGGEMVFYQQDGQGGVVVDGDSGGHGEIRVYDASGATSVQIIGQDSGGNGRVITDVLEILGGADLSESFDINADFAIEPGMVVSIDPEDTGKLIQSRAAYERTVAGIVSGANGVRPGMVMGQRGSIADGEHPVALTGRVWTWCDASDGGIAPGDLLTTSDTPGHAMKVTDHERANGAILGKAMSRLESGRGLVLVLVSLQ